MAESPAYLRSCFDQLGVSAYDDAMLAGVSKIAANSRLCTLQFDIDSHGELGNTFSITSCFERMGADFARHFQEDGAIGHICGLYEQMGVADDRWRSAEHALFAVKKQGLLGLGQEEIMLSTPNCGEAKWIDGVPQPAKFYLLVNVLEQRDRGTILYHGIAFAP